MEMKTVLIREYGSNDVVEVTDVLRPEPAAGEVLVKVHAAGVNPIDWKIRGGAGERMGMTLPIRLGSEVVGTIETCGAGVSQFQKGDAVFGMVPSGAFSQYAVINADHLVLKPKNLSVVEAAAIPLAGTTAWQALFDEAKLSAGQRLLITNSSGGVGSLAIQFAKARGAHVTAVASGRNEKFVRDLGADHFIDYTRQAFEEIATDMDVVLDTMGGEVYHRALRTLKKGGKMITVVAFPQDEAERYGVSAKRSFTVPNALSLREIARLVEAGKVTPYVDAVLPFADVRDALAISEAGRTRGKIVLTVPE
ncbi:UNVERIFIED_ORG: NADPH:quinone reductase-like Zn-dependent oxidoreductase [Agrobacterium larrymoorei]|uniref:NADP-dependent oxidoreductase n=1 Tax=Agrobacterium cavarae TaxID=2528239 RepID=UPI00277DC800|nr:NADP-dependent oxidoreductase [Agrobacterium cavarae]MDP9570843.1 NADPH:quinone reductase-like Zn-dependent oxidoreductase [Agrobacterium larrymoorei]